MGIHGLLPLLKSTMVPFHIKDLKGCSVAVDTYSWLHKGALSCSTQLCKGLPTSRHIEYCMRRVNLLRHYSVEPILVFDGGLLPMKIEQENKRARSRKENLARAIEHESNGNSAAAFECYQKAVDISPVVAYELIQILKQEKVSYIVAPYEADAQMTFLALSKQVDAVITEDSDLIPFGCPRIIYKMDKYGQCVEFQHSRLQQNKELSFSGFSKSMLLEMCILSGCDYLQSLPGMGLKRAHALISKFKSYDKVIKHLRYSTVAVPPLYEESFKKAILTFQHQRVYDPVTEDIVHLSSISDDLGDDLDFLGPLVPQHVAQGIAKGDLDPFTQMPFQVEVVSSRVELNKTSEFKSSKSDSGRKKLDLPVQKNLLTKYFCFASLEAKREFRAPRKSPTNPSPIDNSSLSSKECCRVGTTCKTSCPSASPIDSENVGDALPSTNVGDSNEIWKVENGFAAKDAELIGSAVPEGKLGDKGSVEHTLLQQYGYSTHKPNDALLKECDNKNVPSGAQRKARTENTKVVVRSRYFKHNIVNNIADNIKHETVLVKDDVAGSTCKDVILESPCKIRSPTENVTQGSSYFQHKSGNQDVDNDKEELLVEDNMPIDAHEDIALHKSSLENNYYNGVAVKRKCSLEDTMEREIKKPKQMCIDTSPSSNGCCVPDPEEIESGMKTEGGKFGSNISHLGRYSDIAERSMERFVSVISSFRCTSGSRASGLRAPLKDIQNTSSSRSSAGVDFSKYACKRNNKNTTIASQRC